MEIVLSGAQHRKAGAVWHEAVTKGSRPANPPVARGAAAGRQKARRKSDEQNKNGAEKTAPFLTSGGVKNGFFYSLNVEVTSAARLYRAGLGVI
ncbi:MAG: hypothetical protein KGZ69_01950 [Methylomonas sp.]|nr:hypothetical protein [Methylomonas sp.]